VSKPIAIPKKPTTALKNPTAVSEKELAAPRKETVRTSSARRVVELHTASKRPFHSHANDSDANSGGDSLLMGTEAFDSTTHIGSRQASDGGSRNESKTGERANVKRTSLLQPAIDEETVKRKDQTEAVSVAPLKAAGPYTKKDLRFPSSDKNR
jgi:hypothetical protein